MDAIAVLLAVGAVFFSDATAVQVAGVIGLLVIAGSVAYGVRKFLTQPYDFRVERDVLVWDIRDRDAVITEHTTERSVRVLRSGFVSTVSEFCGDGTQTDGGFKFRFKDDDGVWNDAVEVGPVTKDSLRGPDQFEKVFVYFGHEFDAGVKTDFEVKRTMRDQFPEENEWVEFLCDRPTKVATLQVFFDPGRIPDRVDGSIGPGSKKQTRIPLKPATPASTGRMFAEYRIRKPKVDEVYRITWHWAPASVAATNTTVGAVVVPLSSQP